MIRSRSLAAGGALALAACSGFDLGPEPEPIPSFEQVVFAEALGIDREAFTASGGIWIRDHAPPGGNGDGNGDPPPEPGDPAATGDVVRFWYEGWVSDGTPFDARLPASGSPAALRLGVPGPIPGLAAALTGMREGGVRTAILPPSMGFGAVGADPVPPNAWLVLRLELVEIDSPGEDEG